MQNFELFSLLLMIYLTISIVVGIITYHNHKKELDKIELTELITNKLIRIFAVFFLIFIEMLILSMLMLDYKAWIILLPFFVAADICLVSVFKNEE